MNALLTHMQHKIPFTNDIHPSHTDRHTSIHNIFELLANESLFAHIWHGIFFRSASFSLGFREWMNEYERSKSTERYMIAAAFFDRYNWLCYTLSYVYLTWYECCEMEWQPFCNRSESSIWLDQWKHNTWKLFCAFLLRLR